MGLFFCLAGGLLKFNDFKANIFKKPACKTEKRPVTLPQIPADSGQK